MPASTPELEGEFFASHDGRFMARYGAAGRDAKRSETKICFVATDRAFLVGLLHRLSLRDDCCYVKYSTFERDGMVLGRCFLTTAEAAARLCAEYKAHPKLMVSLQDDDFFNAFRAGG